MEISKRDRLIRDAGGVFSPPAGAPDFLVNAIGFAISNAGRSSPAAKTSTVEVVVTASASTACFAHLLDGQGLILIPVGVPLRLALLYRIFSRYWMAYEIVTFFDAEWQRDTPYFIREKLERKPLHPMVEDVYREDISIAALLTQCHAIETGLPKDRLDALADALKYALWFLMEHERSHIERHYPYSERMIELMLRDRPAWIDMRSMMETDADCRAAETLARALARGLSSLPPRATDERGKLFRAAHYNPTVESFLRLGLAIVLLFSLIIPRRRAITDYDNEPYSHPQVRLVTLNQGLGRGVQSAGCPGHIAVTLLDWFIRGAGGAMSGLILEMIEYNKRMKETNPAFDADAYKPVTSIVLGHVSVLRVHERACAKWDFRHAFVDENGTFSFVPTGPLPTSCVWHCGSLLRPGTRL